MSTNTPTFKTSSPRSRGVGRGANPIKQKVREAIESRIKVA